jgi:hypothetical protein
MKALTDRLNRCEEVTRYDTSAEKQAANLAYDFLDLAESFRTFLNEQLPKRRDESLSCAELDDVLTDIGEEFRHIVWHIHNAEFYAYLREDVSCSVSEERRGSVSRFLASVEFTNGH